MRLNLGTRCVVPLVCLAAVVSLASTRRAYAHCDGLDGPVVKSARKALATRDVNLVLIWVRASDEAEIKQAFAKALAVRPLGAEAQDLADTYFFETLVRVHRAGEGAPYTGLKPAGRDLGPAIPAADRALEAGDVEPLIQLLQGAVGRGLRERFRHAVELQRHAGDDVELGRRYVRQYVAFIHYVERLYEAALAAPAGHFDEGGPADTHGETH